MNWKHISFIKLVEVCTCRCVHKLQKYTNNSYIVSLSFSFPAFVGPVSPGRPARSLPDPPVAWPSCLAAWPTRRQTISARPPAPLPTGPKWQGGHPPRWIAAGCRFSGSDVGPQMPETQDGNFPTKSMVLGLLPGPGSKFDNL